MPTADPIDVGHHVGLAIGTNGSEVGLDGTEVGNDVGVDVDNDVGLDRVTYGTDVGLTVGNDIELDVVSYCGSPVSSNNLQELNAGFTFMTQVSFFV